MVNKKETTKELMLQAYELMEAQNVNDSVALDIKTTEQIKEARGNGAGYQTFVNFLAQDDPYMLIAHGVQLGQTLAAIKIAQAVASVEQAYDEATSEVGGA